MKAGHISIGRRSIDAFNDVGREVNLERATAQSKFTLTISVIEHEL